MARKKQIALLALVGALSCGSEAATRADALFVDETKSLCELAERAEFYDGQSVKVGGVLSWHPHGATFSGGLDCPSERAILSFHKDYSENPAATQEILKFKKNGRQAVVVDVGRNYLLAYNFLLQLFCRSARIAFCARQLMSP
jgi:hypothetical protein